MSFNFEHPPADPLESMRRWLAEAEQETDLPNPNAMNLATVGPDGRPSARIVLLRGLDAEGAVFYTNRESRKGEALEAHAHAALTFHWDVLTRQLRIEGAVSKVTDEESNQYWNQRPRGSQIAAWASQQSRPVPHRSTFLDACAEFEKKFEGTEVSRPPHWGGYRVALDRIEFWQERDSRMHERMIYLRRGEDWLTERLYP
ncbi:MAG: pyridoxamine 5'-phosphate oxidase [Planctomycetes bacterium TMED75]|nr:pyridoxamine 5'-phosphate oxidase [Planctomycetaceae bacterium]OUU95843.1 MAG: pyridoxamine 5'-phosphate oxidase [Planctomycetes bacterium TMED75]